MKRLPILALLSLPLLACSLPAEHAAAPAPAGETGRFQRAPSIVEQAIEQEFPGALPYAQAVDGLIERLERFGIPAESVLWGQSTCPDDITNTKNRPLHPEAKGPFNFGGLAGLPFTGITGLDAFVHHLPESGTALIAVGPHIGYDEREGWGRIIRHDQDHSTTCCGALSAALSKLESGELTREAPRSEDYQQGVIEQFALQHQAEIIGSGEPLLTLTRLIYAEAQHEMSSYAAKVEERHFRYAVVVGAIIINTGFAYPDYLWIDHVSILDVQKNEWVEGSSWAQSGGG